MTAETSFSSDGETGMVFLLSEMESILSGIFGSDTEDHVCYDETIAQQGINANLPKSIPLRARKNWERAPENTLAFVLDYNDGVYGKLYVEANGRIYFSYRHLPDGAGTVESASFVSSPGAFPYKQAEALYRALQNSAPTNDSYDDRTDEEGFIYSIQLSEDGVLEFCRGNENLMLFEAERIESVRMSGYSGVEQTFYQSPEKDQILSLVFAAKIHLRPYDREKEFDQWTGFLAPSDHLHVTVDLNDNERYLFFISNDCRVVVEDSAGHHYISEPGPWQKAELKELANELQRTYNEKYN